MAAAIELRGVHKSFRIPHEKHTTLTERVLSMFRPVSYERFDALCGVDLTIDHGSFVGVVGGNGSGKSTMLKVMSGLLLPDAGEVRVDGSMSALLELGLGFSVELTVRENVELYAAVLGYPRSEQAGRVKEAVEFAGLERFRDAKLKNLSTGMRARLGFSTALQAESDILLLDEILAVGDADFQLKCLDVFEDLKQRRKTVVLVTHGLDQVRRFCDRALWLESGRIAAQGDPDAVIDQYMKSVVPAAQTALLATEAGQSRRGDGRIRVVRAWIEDGEGRQVGRVRSGERAVLVALAEVNEDTEEPIFGFAVKSEDGAVLTSINTRWLGHRTGMVPGGLYVEIRAPFVAALRNGRYSLTIGAGDTSMMEVYDLVEGAASLVVHGSRSRDGLVDLQGEIGFRIVTGDEVAGPITGEPLRQQRGGMR